MSTQSKNVLFCAKQKCPVLNNVKISGLLFHLSSLVQGKTIFLKWREMGSRLFISTYKAWRKTRIWRSGYIRNARLSL